MDNAEYDEGNPGSFFVLCPECSDNAETNQERDEK